MKKYTAVIFLLLSACQPKDCSELGGHNTFILENKSDRNVELKIIENYPDTVIPKDYNPQTDNEESLLPHSKRETKMERSGAGCIEDGYVKGEVNWLYFFDNDSLETLSWDTVRLTGRGILERRAIDLNYLKAHNFTLTYEE